MKLEDAHFKLDVSTNKFQAKLKAISKHTKALAEELEQIDKTTCPDCGAIGETEEQYADNKLVYQRNVCPECGCVWIGKEQSNYM